MPTEPIIIIINVVFFCMSDGTGMLTRLWYQPDPGLNVSVSRQMTRASGARPVLVVPEENP